MGLFDAYLMVDWSAANVPTTGRDSIWIALATRTGKEALLSWVRNIPTRAAAMDLVAETLADLVSQGRRVVAGFDFGFGYPAGAAEKMAGTADWRAVWAMLDRKVVDGADNRSNRFELAARLNADAFAGEAMFWGHPAGRIYDRLLPTKRTAPHPALGDRRTVERQVRSVKSVWQMAYTGSVGSQTMLGIAALERLRRRPELAGQTAVWPFETDFAARLDRPVTITEIYPSLFDVVLEDGEVKDAAQVRTVATVLAALDGEGRLEPLLARPDLPEADIRNILAEEGWIVGTHCPREALAPTPASMRDYLRDPAEIYRQSFATIEREADLSNIPADLLPIAVRLIHACGMVDLVEDLAFSADAAEAGRTALLGGAPILCDALMVRHGIIERLLPAGNEVACLLNDPRVAPLADKMGTTRSAAQVDLWADRLGGAVVAIGNAPTALYRLLELIDAGAPKPALIVAMPVGFVGAAESKAELIARPRGVPFIAVKGRRGGSAMAAATINALAGGLS